MKKFALLLCLILFLLPTYTYAQTCDCATLQARIDELEGKKVNEPYILQLKCEKIDDNSYSFYRNYPSNNPNLIIKNDFFAELWSVSIYENYNYVELDFEFENSSPFSYSFDEQIFIRPYQNNTRLSTTKTLNTMDIDNTKSIAPNEQWDKFLAYNLINLTDDITLEIYEIHPNEELVQVATWIIPLNTETCTQIASPTPTPAIEQVEMVEEVDIEVEPADLYLP